jgi:monofunctional biosynthetic peptidoglycan transglycosylase
MAENMALSSEPVAARSNSHRRSRMRRALRSVVKAAIVLAALPLLLLPLYAVLNPPVSTVMLWKLLGGAPIGKQWADLDQISPHLVRAVLSSEDARFCEHNGIDWVEMEKAMDDDDGRPRGASTITMQTVKNLFLWTNRSWIRKGLEFPLALYAELVLSKKRIMEIYLNIAELGEGIYGAAAASEHYFGVPPAKLSAEQAARLAAILPAPIQRNAAKPGKQTRAAARRIAGRAAKSGAYVGCVLD